MARLCYCRRFHVHRHCLREKGNYGPHLLPRVNKPVASDEESGVNPRCHLTIETHRLLHQFGWRLESSGHSLHLTVNRLSHCLTAIHVVVSQLCANHHILNLH